MFSKPKKWIPMIFAIKSSFKFPALATPNEVDRVMKDWWRMTSLQEHLKTSSFYFACLTTALLHQLRFACFSWGKFLAPTETTVTWTTRISRPIQKPRPFSALTQGHLHRAGVPEAGTLKLVLRALKCQNPKFLLRILFTHYRDTKTTKNLLAV